MLQILKLILFPGCLRWVLLSSWVRSYPGFQTTVRPSSSQPPSPSNWWSLLALGWANQSWSGWMWSPRSVSSSRWQSDKKWKKEKKITYLQKAINMMVALGLELASNNNNNDFIVRNGKSFCPIDCGPGSHWAAPDRRCSIPFKCWTPNRVAATPTF